MSKITEEQAKEFVKQYKQIHSNFSINCSYKKLADILNKNNVNDFVDFVILVEG